MPEHLIHIPVTDSATGQPKQNKKPKEMCMGEKEREEKKGVNQKRRDQEGDKKVGREENRTEQKEGYWLGRKEWFGKLGCRKTDDRFICG